MQTAPKLSVALQRIAGKEMKTHIVRYQKSRTITAVVCVSIMCGYVSGARQVTGVCVRINNSIT